MRRNRIATLMAVVLTFSTILSDASPVFGAVSMAETESVTEEQGGVTTYSDEMPETVEVQAGDGPEETVQTPGEISDVSIPDEIIPDESTPGENDPDGNGSEDMTSEEIPSDEVSADEIPSGDTVSADETVSEDDTVQDEPDMEPDYLVSVIDTEGNIYDDTHPLNLHVGESRHLGLRFTKNDASGKTLDIWNTSQMSPIFDGADVTSLPHSFSLVSKNEAPDPIYTPMDFGTPITKLRTGDTLDGASLWLKGTERAVSGDNIFFGVYIDEAFKYDGYGYTTGMYFARQQYYIPIVVEDPEPGVEYEDPDAGYICDTRREAFDSIREIIRLRINNSKKYGFDNKKKNEQNAGYPYTNYVYERIYVRSNIFKGDAINMNLVTDFERERSDMKPWEGDYITHCIGDSKKPVFHWMMPFSIDRYTTDEIGEDGFFISYDVYEIYLPFITTKAEEDAVDRKIAQLMSTTFAKVKNGTDAQKIKAVYDYIRSHVSGKVSGAGGSDRRYPKYHTAYHALIKGNGTCEAYAMLFTRLTRELGVPSKVIMGVDSNNHAYNIVRNGSYWYYIDCDTGRYLSDAKSFSRAKEQSKFTTETFKNSYLSRIKNSSYKPKIMTWSAVSDNGMELEPSEDFYEIRDQMVNYLKKDPDSHWTLRADGNLVMRETESFDLDLYADRVSLDLQGHDLKLKGPSNSFYFSEIKNGRIYLPKFIFGAYLVIGIPNNAFDEESAVTLTDIEFHVPSKGKGQVPLEDWDNTDYIIDNVTCDNTYFSFGNKERQLVSGNGNIYLTGDLILKNSYLYANSPYQIVSDNYIFEPSQIGIVRTYDDPDSSVPSKEGRLIMHNIGFGQYANPDVTVPMNAPIELHPFEVRDGDLSHPVPASYRNGDLLAEASGTCKASVETKRRGYELLETKMVKADIEDWIKVPSDHAVVPEGLALIYDAPSLLIGKSCIRLSAASTGGGEPDTTEHATFSQAVKAMTKTRGTVYDMELLDGAFLRKDMTLPSFVTSLSVKKAADADVSGNVVLDLKGHKLKSTGGITVEPGVPLISTGKTGTLDFGKSKAVVDIQGETGNKNLSNVKINAPKGSVKLKAVSGNSIINCGTLTIAEGSRASAASVTAPTLTLEKDTSLTASAVTATNASLHEGARLITDKLKVTKKLTAGKDSVTAVNTSGTLGSVVIGGEGAALLKYKPVSGNEASLSISGKISRAPEASDAKLGIGIMESTAEEDSDFFSASSGIAAAPSGITKLFGAKKAPEDGILETVCREGSLNKYDTVYHEMGMVWAGRECIDLDGTGYVKWSDAAKQIAAIKDTGDHTLTFTEDIYAVGGLKMPKKCGTITLKGAVGEGEEKRPAKIYHTGNITLTGDTVLEDLELIRGSGKTAAAYKVLNPYSIMKLEMAGHSLEIAGDVSLNTPVKINDRKKKGSFTIRDHGRIRAGDMEDCLGNEAMKAADEKDSVIAGGISGVSTLSLREGQKLVISDYVTGVKYGSPTKFAAPVFSVKTLDLSGTVLVSSVNADLWLQSDSKTTLKAAKKVAGKGKGIISAAAMEGNATLSADALQIKDMTLKDTPLLQARGAFNITGRLVSEATGAKFVTTRKKAGAKSMPYLAVNGTVTVEDPAHRIAVRVMDADGETAVVEGGYTKDKQKGYTGMLLTAKKADASKFAVEDESQRRKPGTTDPVGEYSESNTGGWSLSKKGTGIYVSYGEAV